MVFKKPKAQSVITACPMVQKEVIVGSHSWEDAIGLVTAFAKDGGLVGLVLLMWTSKM
jgi:hypothetical protein